MRIGSCEAPQFEAKNRQAVRPSANPFGPRGVPVGDSWDLRRILALPRRSQVALDSVTARAMVVRQTAKYARDRTGMGPCRCRQINPDVGCITQLLPVQALATREMEMEGGIVGAVVVGGGKTGIDLLAIRALGLSMSRREQGLLLVPASLRNQICDDYELFSQHFVLPSIVVHRSPRDWTCMVPDQPVLHVMSHDAISSPSESDFIERLRPSAIVIDECDAFANLTSARTMRLNRFMTQFGEQTKFSCWTGSLSDKSLTEFAHFFAWALKVRSPMPLDQEVVEEWARAIDATESPCPPGALLNLCGPEDTGRTDTQRARAGFRRRLAETAGFVVTGTVDVMVMGADNRPTQERVELDVVARQVPPLPDIVVRGLEKVRAMRRPDTLAGSDEDDPIEDELAQAKYAREVACGVCYYTHFPRGEPKDVIKEWYAAKSAWFSECREMMLRGARFMDSPKLCENAAKRAWGDVDAEAARTLVTLDEAGEEVVQDIRQLPEWRAKSWPWWRDMRDKVEPEQRVYRLSDFLVQDAAKWALENKGIVWYGMVELGEWIAEISGLPLHTGGPKAEELLKAELRARRDRSIIASIKSHGRGRNGLQHHFAEQYVINTLSSSKWWEQVLGRLHRAGQRTARLHTEVCLHTPELEKSFQQALRRSDYVYDVFGQVLKLRKAVPA